MKTFLGPGQNKEKIETNKQEMCAGVQGRVFLLLGEIKVDEVSLQCGYADSVPKLILSSVLIFEPPLLKLLVSRRPTLINYFVTNKINPK